MPAAIIDGKLHAARLTATVTERTTRFQARFGTKPGLAVVLVGDDAASATYVRTKTRQVLAAGMTSFDHRLPATIGEADLLHLVAQLNADERVDAILVQLPLPGAIDTARVLEAVDPAKDVDGFHPLNVGRLPSGRGMVPCTPLGCFMLLEAQLGSLAGRRALVVGRSAIVGRPMATLLVKADATVTVAHSKSRDLPSLVAEAEILVAAIGRPALIQGDWIRHGATVIDVGVNRVEAADGARRLVGDVAFAAAAERAAAITPVPGGVGPMTIACLLHNTLETALRRRRLADI